ncbi:MAG: hypothetical protein M1837_005447 [Sclerophora amabilis]|nr:MAG: hypothetical protein M1837_005447 [Sclerophora amabilis]
MAPQSLSIQSFFPRVAPRECTITVPGAASATGSTGSTVETVDDPKHESAKIRATYQHYPKVQIGELDPGPPRAIALRGRIVNVSEPPSTPRKPQAAKGHLRIILQDDTGALVVRVWFATRDYRLHLGRLCSVWTTHVCMGQSSSITPSAPLETSIFPERDSSCYLMTEDEDIEDTSLCRTPLGHCEGRFDPSLVNLRDYLNKGYENSDSKILVCVKGVGARKKFTNKRGRVSHKVEVGVFDDSAEAKLTLWGVATGSAIDWQAAQTVILLSGPAIQAGECSTLSLKNCTHADVDPLMKGAEVLRRWAQGLTGKQIVNASLPHDAPETENILGREERILYTLGELNEFARLHPGEQLTAYLSVVMSAPNFTRLRAGNRLFCGEW